VLVRAEQTIEAFDFSSNVRIVQFFVMILYFIL
jgi:hypothetical protein